MGDAQAASLEAVLKRLEELTVEVAAMKQERDSLQVALQQRELAEKTVRLKPSKPERFDPSRSRSVWTWLFGLNNYFVAVGMPESQGEARIAFAVTLLDGAALEWWRQLQNTSVGDADMAGSDATTTPVKPLKIQFETPLGAETRAKMAVLQMKPTDFRYAMIARWDLVNATDVTRDKLKK